MRRPRLAQVEGTGRLFVVEGCSPGEVLRFCFSRLNAPWDAKENNKVASYLSSVNYFFVISFSLRAAVVFFITFVVGLITFQPYLRCIQRDFV